MGGDVRGARLITQLRRREKMQAIETKSGVSTLCDGLSILFFILEKAAGKTSLVLQRNKMEKESVDRRVHLGTLLFGFYEGFSQLLGEAILEAEKKCA